ncbi:uncharacterized protein LOC124261474 [Haliotis rubra]|uniref:uncharacterized protein LOC124261474 n=1 Tax=Haliotis rubra TaxID=36100 RepID=UPI001EE4FACC|nr:uncharacterized protein LOC124261474 [Haliotis rubra]
MPRFIENQRLRAVYMLEKTTIQDVVAPLKQEIRDLRVELHLKTDELEQYSRRNSLRISGIKEPKWGEEDENIEEVVLEVLKDVHSDISPTYIDRCHRVGKKRREQNRSILVKFVSYWDRNKVIRNKFKLKGKRDNIYINEDLTKYRNHLFKLARDLKKEQRIYSTWTYDGRVYICEQLEGLIRVIQSESDLDKYRRQ